MEISESAWAKAKEVASVWKNGPLGVPVEEIIARAIAQERQECADISENMYSDYYGDRSYEISQAIRNK